MDVDLLSSSDESSFDDEGIMNDVTQPHASEAKDDKEDEKTELSTNSLTDSSPNLAPAGFLLYPRNFFHPTTGANPSTAKDAACLWPYRRERPKFGVADIMPPDGQAMLREIQEIRDSLRMFVINQYLIGLREKARLKNMRINSNNALPISVTDFKQILHKLQLTTENQILVFEVFHSFHRDRSWLSHVIDMWLESEKMCLMERDTNGTSQDGKSKRIYGTDRGGFTPVARQAKSQALAGYMATMLNKAKWCIATAYKKSRFNLYTKVEIENYANSFYLVEKRIGSKHKVM